MAEISGLSPEDLVGIFTEVTQFLARSDSFPDPASFEEGDDLDVSRDLFTRLRKELISRLRH